MDDDTTSTVLDSTSNNNDCTKRAAGEPYVGLTSKGMVQNYDGDTDYIKIAHADAEDFDFEDGSFTAMVFVFPYGLSDHDGLIGKGDYGSGGWYTNLRGDGCVRLAVDPSGGDQNYYASVTGTVVTNNWHLLHLVKNGSTGNIYKNGSEVSYSVTQSLANVDSTTEDFRIGNKDGLTQVLNGPIAEVRVSSGVRNSAWIKATYNSLFNTLLTYGSEEAASGWTGKICGVTNPSKICGIAVADITKVCGV